MNGLLTLYARLPIRTEAATWHYALRALKRLNPKAIGTYGHRFETLLSPLDAFDLAAILGPNRRANPRWARIWLTRYYGAVERGTGLSPEIADARLRRILAETLGAPIGHPRVREILDHLVLSADPETPQQRYTRVLAIVKKAVAEGAHSV